MVVLLKRFTKNERKWAEGQTGQTVELDLLPSHIEFQKS